MNFLEGRYRNTWDAVRKKNGLSEDDVEGSRFFFERGNGGSIVLGNGKPVPKRWDTYAVVANLPYPESLKSTFESLWQKFVAQLGNPLAYGVEPANRHLEIFLFQRPGEPSSGAEVQEMIEKSKSILKEKKRFKINFCYPFLTGDGTVVAKGYDDPLGTIEGIRETLKGNFKRFPKQSEWVHTPLGRILDPIEPKHFNNLVQEMEARWNECIGEVEVKELYWTLEKQWYMVEKIILHSEPLV